MTPRSLVVTILFALALTGCSSTQKPTPAEKAVMKKADPQMAEVLAAHASLQPKPITKLTAVEARRQPSPTDAVAQLQQNRGDASPTPQPPVGRVEMQQVPGPEGVQIPVRIYTPKGDGPFPVIVYYHGGGWVIADLDTYDASCRALTNKANAVVVSVDYRRAPEFKFPAAHEDSYATLQHVMNNAGKFGGDPAKVAVVGESAGGNLATAVCLMAAERGGKMPVHQVLVYPIASAATNTPSYRENAEAKPLNAAMMRWFFDQYLKAPSDGNNVLISPLRATSEQLRRLPPATIITAEIDPLRSEGIAYAQRLQEAGVNVAHRDFTGVTHEFFGMAGVVDKAGEAQQFAADRLKQAFAGTR